MGMECCYTNSNLRGVAPTHLAWYMASNNHGKTTGGFTSVMATPAALTVTYHDQDGVALFTAEPIAPRVV